MVKIYKTFMVVMLSISMIGLVGCEQAEKSFEKTKQTVDSVTGGEEKSEVGSEKCRD